MTQEQTERIVFLYFKKFLTIEEIQYVLCYNDKIPALLIKKEIIDIVVDILLNTKVELSPSLKEINQVMQLKAIVDLQLAEYKKNTNKKHTNKYTYEKFRYPAQATKDFRTTKTEQTKKRPTKNS
jgi:hypothetical protein